MKEESPQARAGKKRKRRAAYRKAVLTRELKQLKTQLNATVETAEAAKKAVAEMLEKQEQRSKKRKNK